MAFLKTTGPRNRAAIGAARVAEVRNEEFPETRLRALASSTDKYRIWAVIGTSWFMAFPMCQTEREASGRLAERCEGERCYRRDLTGRDVNLVGVGASLSH